MFLAAQKEMYGRDVIYNSSTYIIYKLHEDKSLYVHMIYTRPEDRKTGQGKKLLEELVSLTEAKSLVGYVDLTTNNPELSIYTHLSYGAKVLKSNPDSIVFYKEIK